MPWKSEKITLCKLLLLLLYMCVTTTQSSFNVNCISLILDLQRSNEMHKNIKCPGRRIKCLPINIDFTKQCIFSLIMMTCIAWFICLLIMLCGDVESNPGPFSVDSHSDSNSDSSSYSINNLTNHLSIMHLNIQSLIPKLDLIEGESMAYDVLVFSESWLKPEVSNDKICIGNFLPPFRTDRNNRPGGGVVIYVRDTFSCIRRTNLEIRGLEAVWVEILIESKKVLVGGFYRPPNTDAHYFNHIIESIDRAHNTDISDIIILGDFNYNMLSDNYNKMKELTKTYNMKQLIAEPTYFTENSSSLIDLIIIRNNNNILTSGVADTFIPDQIRHYCPTVVLLKFLRPHCKTFKRKIWNNKLADYTKYRSL